MGGERLAVFAGVLVFILLVWGLLGTAFLTANRNRKRPGNRRRSGAWSAGTVGSDSGSGSGGGHHGGSHGGHSCGGGHSSCGGGSSDGGGSGCGGGGCGGGCGGS